MKIYRASGEIIGCEYCKGTEFYQITEQGVDGNIQEIDVECADGKCMLETTVQIPRGEKLTVELPR